MASAELTQVLSLLRSLTPPELPAALEPERDVRRLRELLDGIMPEVPPTVRRHDTSAGGVSAEWLLAGPDVDPSRRLLYLHGGAYIAGSRRSHRSLAARLGRASHHAVLLLEYRLAPEHPLPAAVDDALAALAWIAEHGPDGPSPARQISVGGDSAGGGLTLLTLLAARERALAVDAAFTLSAWTDLAGTGESLRTRASVDPMLPAWLLPSAASLAIGGRDPRSPSVSPLYADPAGLPRLLMQVGDAEILLDDSTRFAERARAAGAPVELEVWPDLFHVWHAFAGMLPEGRQAIARVGEFLRSTR